MPEEYINLKTGKRNRKRMERENRIEGIFTHFERTPSKEFLRDLKQYTVPLSKKLQKHS